MPFSRAISKDLISALNQQWEIPNSWWHRLAENQDYVVALRDDYLNVYRNGCNIARVSLNRGQLEAQIHYKFLLKNNASNPYISCTDGIPKIDTHSDYFIQSLASSEDIKAATNLYGGLEKTGVHQIILSNTNIIDTEIALSAVDTTELIDDSRIDLCSLCLINNIPTLRFIEAKHSTNHKSLRKSGNNPPEVIEQLHRYENFLEDMKKTIIAEYKKLLESANQIKGSRILGKNSINIDSLALDTRPRLAIFGFDKDQQKQDSIFYNHMEKIRDFIGKEQLLLKGDAKGFVNGIGS